ncbi:hypothetical protein PYW07_014248 [Mythimna separata]|uniref:adenylate cyclase n=1 Tax=Mythimna separata TaxID=271217 RepID=A0AAD7YY00_MYTSE|nr:hypothetical protein PYW07_014248 [Mythimna separata]
MESIQDMNRRLLAHILPDHVVNHFLSRDWRPDNLYSQQHDEAGVLFACIANFNSIREEDSLKCLRVLNFFILRFDELLLKPEFKCIEKIKTITATYMAASRLDPKHKSEMEEHGHLHALCDYAFALMKALECLPKYSLELRAGISCGPLVGGVIGARKPVYDIWGNTVNEASRMESTGEIRRIQVTNHAQQLLRNRFELKYRGHVAVKGKGMMETWWVMGRKVTSTDTNLCDDPGDKVFCAPSDASSEVSDSETESDSESSLAQCTTAVTMPANFGWKLPDTPEPKRRRPLANLKWDLHNFAPEPCGLRDSVQRSAVSNICDLSDDSTTPDMRTLGEILFSQDETPEQHPLASFLFSMQQTRQHIHMHPLYSSEESLADPEVKVS